MNIETVEYELISFSALFNVFLDCIKYNEEQGKMSQLIEMAEILQKNFNQS